MANNFPIESNPTAVDINKAVNMGGLNYGSSSDIRPAPPTSSMALTPGQFNNTPPVSTSVVGSNAALNGPVNTARNIVNNPPKPALYDTKTGYTTPYGLSQGLADNRPPTQTTTTADTSKTGTQTSTGTSVSTPGNPTPEDSINHDGETQFYDTHTGQTKWLPNTQLVNGQPPAGYTINNPKTQTAVDTTSGANGGTLYKYANDTYGFIDAQGNWNAATADTFNKAKQNNTAYENWQNAANGILTEDQKTQVDAVTRLWEAAIKKQETINANATGAQTLAQNMYGMGNTLIGQGEITKVMNDGADKITQLQAQMTSAIADLKQSFIDNDAKLLKTAYDSYNEAISGIDSAIKNTQTLIQNAQIKQDNANVAINTAMAKKYDDVDLQKYPGGITPDMTAEERLQALQTSGKYQQATALQKVMTPEENDWYADFEASGAAKHLSLPGGRSAAGIQQNIPIIQAMIKKSLAAGISGSEFGQALVDKTTAASVLNKIKYQGENLRTNEDKVKQDIEQLKGLADKVNTKEFQSNIPLLQKYLQGVDVHLTGSQAYVDYMGLLKTTLTAYARVVNSQTGSAGTTVSINDEVQKIIPDGASPKMAIDYLTNVAIPEMEHTTSAFKNTEKDLGNVIGNAIGAQTYGATNSNLSTSTTSAPSSSFGGSAWQD